MNTEQPKALQLADKYEVHGFMGDHRFAKDHWCSQAAAELRSLHTRVQELEKSESDLIAERDYRDEIIDLMADAVLGTDRAEWSSSYDFIDATQEVEDRIAELEAQLSAIGAGGVEPLRKRAADDKPEAAREKLEKELRRLHARVQELEASKEQRKPLTDEQILDELLGYHGYIHGYMPADCDWLDFARAIEHAHGITQEKHHGE